MALRSILYRKDTGVVIDAMSVDHQWSDVEKGLIITPKGFYFAVSELDVTEEQLNCDDVENPTPCISMKTLKVNDVDNPTSLIGV